MPQYLENNDYSLLKLGSLCIDVTIVRSQLTSIDLPYHCDVNTQTTKPQ